MRAPIQQSHFTDADGNPAGGSTFGNGFAIAWQNGPLGRGDDRRDPNGAFVEDIIAAAAGRIAFYQSSRFACEENEAAFRYLHEALACLHDRTASREARDVEGTHQA
jgi:hypothetical protein